jgi:hypothetical protein
MLNIILVFLFVVASTAISSRNSYSEESEYGTHAQTIDEVRKYIDDQSQQTKYFWFVTPFEKVLKAISVGELASFAISYPLEWILIRDVLTPISNGRYVPDELKDKLEIAEPDPSFFLINIGYTSENAPVSLREAGNIELINRDANYLSLVRNHVLTRSVENNGKQCKCDIQYKIQVIDKKTKTKTFLIVFMRYEYVLSDANSGEFSWKLLDKRTAVGE